MTNKIKFLILIIFITITAQATMHAAPQTLPDNYLRVGLSSPTQAVRIYTGTLGVFLLVDGHFINMSSTWVIHTGSGAFTLTADNSYYVFAEGLSDGPNTVHILQEHGFPGTWVTHRGPFASAAEAQSSIAANGGILVAPTGRRLALHLDGETLAVFENNNLTPFFANSLGGGIGGKINIGGYYYRGFLQVHRAGSNVTPINVVHMEDYLLSVVPSEMPASWPLHALKAQAVAARSYAYTRAGVHADRGYDLCASVCCQVYLGMRQESERSTAAVHYTRGLFALHNGNVINAVYSSSSGGITDNSENVWTEASPYLRSVSDIHDTTGRKWSRTFTLSELTHIANANNHNIGNVQSVQIAGVSNTGRVSRLVLHGQNGQVTLEREMIRTFFSPSAGGSLYSRNFRLDSFNITAGGMALTGNAQTFIIGSGAPQQRALNTLRFMNAADEIVPLTTGNVNVQTAAGIRVMNLQAATYTTAGTTAANQNIQITGGLNSTGDTVTFIGRGWGHGVGLSQHGARGMAYAGYTFDRILKHYYTGITLQVRH